MRPMQAFKGHDDPELTGMIAGYLDGMASRPDIGRVHAAADALLGLRPGLRVLDAGCGTGATTMRLARAVAPAPGGEAVGVDLSPALMSIATERADGAPVRFERADVTALPFDADSFDAARCERVLQHLDDPDAAVRELVRVVRPGGRVRGIDSEWSSLCIDLGDEHAELTDRVLAHFEGRATQRRMGSSQRRRFLRAGLVDVDVRVVPLTFTSLDDGAGVIPQLRSDIPEEAGLLPFADREAWFAATREAHEAGELWVCLLMYVTCGTKPA